MVAFEHPVAAQSLRVAALAPQFKSGGNTPELRDRFHEAVLKGLSSLSGPSGPNGELGDVVTLSETKRRLGEELLSCGNQASCLPKALRALQVNRLLSTELSVIGKSYNISMRLYDGEGHELTHVEELCEICTVREADEAVTKSATRLAAASRTFPVQVAVPAKPDKSPEPVRPPPIEQPPVTSKVSPMQPQAAQPPTLPTPGKERRKVPWRILGFSSLGLGIVGLAAGIPLLVIDGRPTCSAADPTHQCPDLYNTAAGGAALVAIGVIGLIGAVPLFYLDYRERNRGLTSLRLDATPSSGSLASLTLTGRF